MPNAQPHGSVLTTSATLASGITSGTFTRSGASSIVAVALTYNGDFVGGGFTDVSYGADALQFLTGATQGGNVSVEFWAWPEFGTYPTETSAAVVANSASVGVTIVMTVFEIAHTSNHSPSTVPNVLDSITASGTAIPVTATLTGGGAGVSLPTGIIPAEACAMFAVAGAYSSAINSPSLALTSGTQLQNMNAGAPPVEVAHGLAWMPATGSADTIEWTGTIPLGTGWAEAMMCVVGTRIIGVARAGGVIPYEYVGG